jgi:hypothetical protein
MQFVFLIWIAVAAVGVGVFLYSMYTENKRREVIKTLSGELGLEYFQSLPSSDQLLFNDFQLAGQGRGRKTSNVIIADSGELRMILFDYQYTTGSGKNSSTHRQSVALVSSQNLRLPEFKLAPEGFFQRVAEFFGSKDIDFEDDAEFSKRYLLQGPEETAIREFFDAERRKRFLELDRLHVEGRDRSFIFFQLRTRHDSDAIKGMMQRAYQIYSFLSE